LTKFDELEEQKAPKKAEPGKTRQSMLFNAGITSCISEWSVYLGIVKRIFPLVKHELGFWKQQAASIPDYELAKQAVSSIQEKSFHCMGGAVFALLNTGMMKDLVKAIVAIQTISDYLDNLCDRVEQVKGEFPGANPVPGNLFEFPKVITGEYLSHGNSESISYRYDGCDGSDKITAETLLTWDSSQEAAARTFACFMRLHEAMLCAVDPLRPTCDYYRGYPMWNDGGYLNDLVDTARRVIGSIKDYCYVKPLVLMFARMYSELQSIKHLPEYVREDWMEQWFTLYSETEMIKSGGIPLKLHEKVGKLKWWEFGAATGSTLGIFSLIAYSSLGIFETSEDKGTPARTGDFHAGQEAGPALSLAIAYFPSICGLHILLDYFIDQEEDKKSRDLNFVSYYDSAKTATEALKRFIQASLKETRSLPEPWFHRAVVRGLLAMYLADPKVRICGLSSAAKEFTRCGGGNTEVLQAVCGLFRRSIGF
jgi:tetraprenyl-beta-curcumene synthase